MAPEAHFHRALLDLLVCLLAHDAPGRLLRHDEVVNEALRLLPSDGITTKNPRVHAHARLALAKRGPAP